MWFIYIQHEHIFSSTSLTSPPLLQKRTIFDMQKYIRYWHVSLNSGRSRISQTGNTNLKGGGTNLLLAKLLLKTTWKWKKLELVNILHCLTHFYHIVIASGTMFTLQHNFHMLHYAAQRMCCPGPWYALVSYVSSAVARFFRMWPKQTRVHPLDAEASPDQIFCSTSGYSIITKWMGGRG